MEFTKKQLIEKLQNMPCPDDTPICSDGKDEEWWVEPISYVELHDKCQIGYESSERKQVIIIY